MDDESLIDFQFLFSEDEPKIQDWSVKFSSLDLALRLRE